MKEPTPLSDRERQVLMLVSSGLSAKEIAESLYIYPVTVRNHLSNIMMKLKTNNIVHALAIALDRGLITLPSPADFELSDVETRATAKSCFIAASSGTNLDVLMSVLEELGIEPIVPSVLPIVGRTLLEYVAEAIERTDLMVAVLGSDVEEFDSNVLFELGQAYALRKRILVLVQPSVSKLPSLMQGLFYLRAGLANRKAIRFALEQLTRRPLPTSRGQESALSESHPLGPLADVLLERLEALSDHGTEHQLVEIVSDMLRASGISILEEPTTNGDVRPDLAAWSDELEAWLGGPLLVEIRKQIESRDAAERIRNQVLTYMTGSSSPWALVVYERALLTDFDPVSISLPMVFFLQLNELIQNLKTKSFSEIILDIRNRVAHGEVTNGTNIKG